MDTRQRNTHFCLEKKYKRVSRFKVLSRPTFFLELLKRLSVEGLPARKCKCALAARDSVNSRLVMTAERLVCYQMWKMRCVLHVRAVLRDRETKR